MHPSLLFKALLLPTFFFLNFYLVSTLKVRPPHGAVPRIFRPRIWLNEYLRLDAYSERPLDRRFRTHFYFEDEFVSKNGSDYIIYPGIYSVVFTCKASYPIKWSFPFPEQAKEFGSYDLSTMEYRHSEFSSTMSLPRNKFFASTLMVAITGSTFTSINLTCKSTDNLESPHESSVYITKSGMQVQPLENLGKTITVAVPYDSILETHFVLPCRPGALDVDLILEKQISTENMTNSWKEIQLNSKYISFDPKVGFSLDKRLLSNIYGLYRCKVNPNSTDTDLSLSIENDKEAFVYMNVTKLEPSDVEQDLLKEFKPFSKLSGNASINLEKSEKEYVIGSVIKCCSPENKSLRGRLTRCFTPTQCELMKPVFMNNIKTELEVNWGEDCWTESIFDGSSMIYCKGQDLEYLENFFVAFYPNMQNVEDRAKIISSFGQNTNFTSLLFIDTAANISNLPIDQKVLISVAQYNDQSWFPQDGYGYGTYFFRKGWDPQLGMRFGMYEEEVTLEHSYIAEFGRSYYYDGEKLAFMCIALKMFYTYGNQVRVNWKNGTTTLLKQVHIDASLFLRDKMDLTISSSGDDIFVHTFTEELKASTEMKSVECIVPPWNSTKWDVANYELEVRPSLLSQFEIMEQVVYLTLNDVDKQITFNVMEGIPRPTVNLFKDDKPISNLNEYEEHEASGHSSYNYTTNLDELNSKFQSKHDVSDSSFTVKIGFPMVTYDVHGVYVCRLENVKGNVTATVKVIVTGPTNHVGTILCLFVGLLGLLLVGIGIWYKWQHKSVQALRFGISRL